MISVLSYIFLSFNIKSQRVSQSMTMKLRHKKPMNSYKTDKDDDSSEIFEDDYRRQFASIRKQTTVGDQQINKMARILVQFLNSINEDYRINRPGLENGKKPENPNLQKFLSLPKKTLKELQLDLKQYQKKQQKIKKKQIDLIASEEEKHSKPVVPNTTQQKPAEKINKNIQFIPPVFNNLTIKPNPTPIKNPIKPNNTYVNLPNSKPEPVQAPNSTSVPLSFQQTKPSFSNLPNLTGFQAQNQTLNQGLNPQLLYALLQKQNASNMGSTTGNSIPNMGNTPGNVGNMPNLSSLGLGNMQAMNLSMLQQQLMQSLNNSSGKPPMNYMSYVQNLMLLDYLLKLAPYQMQMQQSQTQQQQSGPRFQPAYLNIANYMNMYRNANNNQNTNQSQPINGGNPPIVPPSPQVSQPVNKRQQTLNKRACYHITIAYSTYLAKLNEQGKNLRDYKIEDLDPTAFAKKLKERKKSDNILINIESQPSKK